MWGSGKLYDRCRDVFLASKRRVRGGEAWVTVTGLVLAFALGLRCRIGRMEREIDEIDETRDEAR